MKGPGAPWSSGVAASAPRWRRSCPAAGGCGAGPGNSGCAAREERACGCAPCPAGGELCPQPPAAPRGPWCRGSHAWGDGTAWGSLRQRTWGPASAPPPAPGAGVPRYRGAGVPRCRDTGVPRYRGAGVLWCRGAGVPEYRGAAVLWCRGTGVPRCRGAGVPRALAGRRGSPSCAGGGCAGCGVCTRGPARCLPSAARESQDAAPPRAGPGAGSGTPP